MVRVAIQLAAEARSYKRAAVSMKYTLGHGLSAKSIERFVGQIGLELCHQQLLTTSKKDVLVPDVAVVSCDGGRIRTRAQGCGPGVHDPAWNETKNASFEKMTSTPIQTEDPCPELPDTFRQVAHVAKIAEKPAFSVAAEPKTRPKYKGPKRMLRTCLSSMACSADFGKQMEREARRRRLHEAPRRVFIGDGLPWNWSIQSQHFKGFTQILDFIHALQYAYAAAAQWEDNDESRWQRYLQIAEALWQGKVDVLIEQLKTALSGQHVIDALAANTQTETSAMSDAVRYFTNNRQRMDYPRYRKEGLPLTSSPMESLIKQINQRVKGTEMFWNHPEGAEAILQVRAAHLCEDGRLEEYLNTRPGSPYARRPQLKLAG